MNGAKQIPTLLVVSTRESELKEVLVDKDLLQTCSIEEEESKGIIVNKCSTEEDE